MRHLVRPVAIAVALALTTVACGATDDLADSIGDAVSEAGDAVADGDGGATAPPDATAAPEGGGAGDPAQDPGQPGPSDGGAAGGGTGATDGGTAAPVATPVDDLGPVGANARAMLRPDRARLVVEIDVQQGQRVDQGSVDHLIAQLASHADKPGGIALVGGNTFQSQRTEWTAGDLRAVAEANRETRSTDDQVSLYLLYVNGGFHADGERTQAIGVTYRASEIAVFPDRWSGLGGLLGSDQAIERAVLVHELGHALGLVNLVYDSDIDHEDGDHPGHSSNDASVMFWAIESTVIGQVFSGPPPSTFDADDAADLEGLRTGRY